MTSYPGKALEQSEFRLVTLAAGSFSAPLSCSLQIFPLGDSIPYEALSYAWGSVELSENIQIDDGEIAITKELGKALRHLRRTDQPRTLWIDAICINQDDISERNSQVAVMTEVYRSAQRVVVWLGEEDESSDVALAFLKEMATYKKGTLRGTHINGKRQGSDTSSECGDGGVSGRDDWYTGGDEHETETTESEITDSEANDDINVVSGGAEIGSANSRKPDAQAESESMGSPSANAQASDLGEFPSGTPEDESLVIESEVGRTDIEERANEQSAEDRQRRQQLDDFSMEWLANQDRRGHISTGLPVLYYDFSSTYDKFFHDAQQAKWEALDQLLARPWWSRTWVVQEVWHSSDCILQCGNSTLKWKTFEKAMDYQESWDDMGYLVQQTKRWEHWSSLKKRYGLAIHLSKKRLLGAKLSDILWNTWDREASDPRDKVFAILSLVDEGAHASIPRPDYALTMQQCFIDVAKHIIQHDKKLDLLLAANGIEKRGGLPSWVPDWRREANDERPALFINGSKMRMLSYFSGSTDYVVLHGHGYSASGNFESWVKFSQDGSGLQVRSVQLGIVAHVGSKCTSVNEPAIIISDARSVIEAARVPSPEEDELRTILTAGSYIEEDDRWAMPGRKDDQVIQSIMNKRRFFITDHGHLCIGPARSETGDVVCIFSGCNFPMVLRSQGGDEFVLIGEAYGK